VQGTKYRGFGFGRFLEKNMVSVWFFKSAQLLKIVLDVGPDSPSERGKGEAI